MEENERIAKLEAKVDELDEAMNWLEKRLDMQEQQISNLKDNEGKLPPWAAAFFTILTTLVGAIIAACIRIIWK